MTDRERNMRVVCGLLGLELNEVFDVDGGDDLNVWRITADHGLERFNTFCCGEMCCGGITTSAWEPVWPAELTIDSLLLGDYPIRKFPNSPLKTLPFGEPYGGTDCWGEGMEE